MRGVRTCTHTYNSGHTYTTMPTYILYIAQCIHLYTNVQLCTLKFHISKTNSEYSLVAYTKILFFRKSQMLQT